MSSQDDCNFTWKLYFFKKNNLNKLNFVHRLVAKFLSLFDSEYNLRQLIMIDYYVAGLWWCREQNFNGAQTSAFYTLMDTLVKNIGMLKSLVAWKIMNFKQILHY